MRPAKIFGDPHTYVLVLAVKNLLPLKSLDNIKVSFYSVMLRAPVLWPFIQEPR